MSDTPPPGNVASTVETTTIAAQPGGGQVTTVEQVQAQQAHVTFLQDDAGHNSSMRLMAFIALLASVVMGLITMLDQRAAASANGLYLTGLFLSVAFTGKCLQKLVEVTGASAPTR